MGWPASLPIRSHRACSMLAQWRSPFWICSSRACGLLPINACRASSRNSRGSLRLNAEPTIPESVPTLTRAEILWPRAPSSKSLSTSMWVIFMGAYGKWVIASGRYREFNITWGVMSSDPTSYGSTRTMSVRSIWRATEMSTPRHRISTGSPLKEFGIRTPSPRGRSAHRRERAFSPGCIRRRSAHIITGA